MFVAEILDATKTKKKVGASHQAQDLLQAICQENYFVFDFRDLQFIIKIIILYFIFKICNLSSNLHFNFQDLQFIFNIYILFSRFTITSERSELSSY